MRTAIQLLAHLRELGVRIGAAGDKLQIRGAKGVLTPELTDELKHHKAELLELLGGGAADREGEAPALVALPPGAERPLSFAQQRLWFLQRLAPDNASYNIDSLHRLRGLLDESALRAALDGVLARHEVLRSLFPERDGTPRQAIGEIRPAQLACIDLTAVEEDEREAEARRRVRAETLRPFDLSVETPARFALVRLAEREHLLLVVLHHVAADGWSLSILHRELASLYAAAKRGEAQSLPAPAVQYGDYAAWQRAWFQGDVLARHLRYWSRALAHCEPLELPIDHPRPALQSFRGEHLARDSRPGLVPELEALGRPCGATLYTVLLAAFGVVARGFSGQDEVVVGSPVSNRDRTELESLIGCFLNMLTLRTDLGGDPTFAELLTRQQEVVLGALRHQALPFERLVEELVPHRDLARNPLFGVFFAVQNAPEAELELEGLVAERPPVERRHTNFDFELHAWPRPNGTLHLDFVTNAELYEASTVRAVADAFSAVLEQLVADPGCRLSELALLGEPAQRAALAAQAWTAPAAPELGTITELFARQAARSPGALAVTQGERALSYGELAGRAAALAAHLRGRGVGPGSLVGVCLERSPELVVALLGILEAGGAYVPLDPSMPAERLAYVLEDTGASLVLTQSSLGAELSGFGAALLLLDEPLPESAAPTSGAAPGPDDLAYVIHTSGSTGKPKGVQLCHASVVNFLESMAREPGLTADDALLAVTTLTFDIAALELFLPLCVGGRVEIATREVVTDGRRLAQTLQTCGATAMQATPAMWQMLLQAGWKGDGRLKMLCGGEELPRSLARELCERGGELWNLYGPTETTIWSAVHRVGAEELAEATEGTPGGGAVTIGEPIAETRLLVLDERRRPVPRGAAGELFIAGAGLARGYLRRPELDAEKFAASPWPELVAGRLYRTGDAVRVDAAGRLRFLGRIDNQIKLRGFRIEPGEIEAVLREHPDVRQAVALVREEAPGDRRLVAYLVPRGQSAPTAAELREHLRTKLPDYMVPGAFVALDELPLSPAGKVDRRALREIRPGEELEPASGARSVPPRGPVEEALAAAFVELLGRQRVGVHDDFFEHGGHSLLATRLVSRVRDVFRIELPLSEVFEAPTVAGLAERVDARRGAAPRAPAPPLEVLSRDQPLPLSFAQRRLWLLDQLGTGAAYQIGAVLGLEGALDRGALEGALNATVARHETLRTRFVAIDGEPRQVIEPERVLPLTVVERGPLPAEQRAAAIRALVESEADRGVDLERGPLLHAALLGLGPDEHVLVLTFHHIIADGWSLDLLVRELAEHYRAAVRGSEARLPRLPVQYADFAAWQRAYLVGEALEQQLAYWTETLADGVEVLELATDRPRPPVQTFAGRAHVFTVEPRLLARLRELCRERGVTLAMACLAGFQALLARYTGQREIVVGSPVAGRSRAEVEDLIGFFVNSLVLRTDVSGDPTFGELLARVQRVSLEAYDHQDLPFEMLVDALDPERDPSRTPLFQVVFALHHLHEVELESEGLVLRVLPSEALVTRFDLELHLFEAPDGLSGSLLYNTDLFDAQTIERLVGHLVNLLAGAADDPDARLSELALLGAAERETLLVEWNDTAVELSGELRLHRLIEARAAERPQAPALCFGERVVGYAEMNARANRVAHVLRERGVGVDQLVGLCVERGPEMVIGLLGILKAGGAYVPMDPTYPRERLAFMLEDSQVGVLVTQETLLERLPEGGAGYGAQVLCLDRDGGELEAADASNPTGGAGPDDLAYAIYTSGSTGTPKAALLTHRGICNVSQEQARAFGVGPGSRVLQFSSLSFDASTFEVVMALPKGATLFLGEREELLPGPELSGFLRRHAIDTVTLPPTALANLPLADLPDLATITVAGEACSAELVARWAPGRRFFNLYGPTEATIWSSMAKLAAGDEPHIGGPIGNTRLYVLDAHGNPAPIGVPGELHIGGVGLARGYHARPELSAERFVDWAPRAAPAERLYKSGDVVRWRSDGRLEFLGRSDHQVKLRGHRIELGEIEALLDAQAGVRQSLALVREDAPGDRRLVAYVVPDPSQMHAAGAQQEDWEHDHVNQWQTLYEQSYGQAGSAAERTFNISAWDSSYTGAAIPAEQMRAWLDETVAGVLATEPRRVLELGCGMGLILFRVAPHCEEYLGTDFSRAALDYVERLLPDVDLGGAEVRLECRSADGIEDLPAGHFDTVVLNSVAQYFPSAEYLVSVIEKAVERIRPGGALFLGDLRSLPLLSAFHTSVQLHRAEDGLDAATLRRRVHQQTDQDQELVIEPALFEALREHIPRLSRVHVAPKRGRYDNELSRFRYDVLLELDGEATGASAASPLDWQREGLDLEALRRRLGAEAPDRLELSAVPNLRTCRDACAAGLLDSPELPATVAELTRLAADQAASLGAVHPDDLWELADSSGYDAQLSWAGGHPDGAFDAVLLRRGAAPPPAAASPRAQTRRRAPRPWGAYANLPLRGRVLRELVPGLREAVAERLPAYMVPAAFLVLDAFPLTPNGKVDRRALPAPDALRGGLGDAYTSPSSEVEERLARVWARILGLDRVGVNDDFFELGGDSILSIQVVAAAREAGVLFTAKDLFQHKTVAELARAVGSTEAVEAEQGPVSGEVPPTPIQAWFHGLELEAPQHFNQALVLTSEEALDPAALQGALDALLEHHDALRLRARRGADGWRQELAPPGDAASLETHDLTGLSDDERRERVEAIASGLQASLDLGAGPLLRAALFRGGERRPDLLLIVVHHLAVDAVSWSILLEDLERALEQLRRGEAPTLPAKTTSVQAWARALREVAGTPAIAEQAEAWLHLAWQNVAPLPVDQAGGANRMESTETLECRLSEAVTETLLNGLPATFGAEMPDALLAALARALGEWSGGGAVAIDLEGHGREELVAGLDVSRTVGWFTAKYPLVLPAGLDRDPVAALKGAREARRALADRALAHGLARHLAPNERPGSALASLPEPEISLNYLGRLERTLGTRGRFRLADFPAGPSRGPANRRSHLLEINAAVTEGGLRVVWTYGRDQHVEATLRRVADRLVQELERLAELCDSPAEPRPADPGLADFGWGAEDLDDIMSEIDKRS